MGNPISSAEVAWYIGLFSIWVAAGSWLFITLTRNRSAVGRLRAGMLVWLLIGGFWVEKVLQFAARPRHERLHIYGLHLDYLLLLAAWLVAGCWLFVSLLRWRQRFKTLPGRLRLVNAGLSLWMFLSFLTALEIYFAVFYDQTDSFNMLQTSRAWYGRHVDPYRNNEGFRDVLPLLAVPPDGVKRIWIMGDSFTFGHGVKRPQDRFSDRVGMRLESRFPGRVMVNNISDAGTNATQVRGLLDVYFSRGFQPPKTVVYVLCLNDIEVYDQPRTAERYRSMGDWMPPNFLLKESYFLNWVWFRTRQVRQPQVRDYYGDLVEAYAGPPVNRFMAEIDAIKFTCRTYRVDFRVVIFPFLHNLGPDYRFGPAHEKIARHCRDVNIPVLDLRPVLEPHAKEGLVVNRYDAHPNERAHELAAEAIEKEFFTDWLAEKNGSTD